MEPIIACFKIDGGQPVFGGHFPGNPILPGVLGLSFIKAALYASLSEYYEVLAVKKIKFIQPIVPDCEVSVVCKIVDTEETGRIMELDCVISACAQARAKARLRVRHTET